MESVASRRVVITGVGVVTPLGNDPDMLVEALRSRASGIRPLTQLPAGVLSVDYAAEAVDFTGKIEDYGPLEKQLQRTIRKGAKVMCREIELGVAVAQRALHDAALDSASRDAERTGVLFGCDYIMSQPIEFAAGIEKCMSESEFEFARWGAEGKPQVNPLWLLKYLPNMPASHVAIYNDLRGPNNSITVREASSGAAIAEAYSTISRGHADVLVVGATGSRIHPLRSLHADMQEALASNRDDPTTMSRPFAHDRDGAPTPLGRSVRVNRFEVVYVFDTGRGDFAGLRAYLPLETAQLIFNRDFEVDRIALQVTDPEAVEELVGPVLAAARDNVIPWSWKEFNSGLLRALRIEDNMMFILMGIILLAASLNIVSGLVMLVKNKGSDIGILRTIGLSRGAVTRVFFLCGAFIGTLGTVLGVLLAALFVAGFDAIFAFVDWLNGGGLFDAEKYRISVLKVRLEAGDVLFAGALSIGLSWIITIFPARYAARLNPVEALRRG